MIDSHADICDCVFRSGGSFINFDLAFPSSAIPSDFFPSNASFYGYTDFGVWNISYQSVDCSNDWAGRSDASALGSVADEGTSVCCPANPTVRTSFNVAHELREHLVHKGINVILPHVIHRAVQTIPVLLTRTKMAYRTSRPTPHNTPFISSHLDNNRPDTTTSGVAHSISSSIPLLVVVASFLICWRYTLAP